MRIRSFFMPDFDMQKNTSSFEQEKNRFFFVFELINTMLIRAKTQNLSETNERVEMLWYFFRLLCVYAQNGIRISCDEGKRIMLDAHMCIFD